MKVVRLLGRVVLVFGLSAVLVVVGVFLFWYFGPDLCRNEVISELSSPDGAKKLVVFQRDCGATTGFSTHASILPAGKMIPSQNGNVFISDTDHGAAPSGPGGGPRVEVTWEGPNSVVLSYHPKVRVFVAEREVSGVQIHYATAP